MTTTYALVYPAVEALDLQLRRISDANEANFAMVRNDPGAVDYVYNAGAGSDTITLQARRSHSNNVTTCKLTVLTSIRKTVSETGEVTDSPVSATLAWSHEGKVAPDISSLKLLIEHVMGFYCGALTGANGNPTGIMAEKFDRNVLVNLP